jgi:Flp pilus assembly protein TadD
LILIARLQGAQPEALSDFTDTRQQLSRSVETSPRNAALLSDLAVVDALLGRKEDAISEAKRAVEMLPVAEDAIDGPDILKNLAVVYAWSDEPNLALEHLERLSRLPYGVFYSDLKLAPYFEPLRKDPRFDRLLAQLAPHN